MGKGKNSRKDNFIDPKRAVVVKLGTRDLNDPNRNDSNKNEPTFQIVSYPDEQFLTEKEITQRDKILNNFDDIDQGKYDYKDSKEHQFVPSQNHNALDMAKDRPDLWIHTLQKLKSEQIRSEMMKTGKYDDVEVDVEEEEYYDEEEDGEYEAFDEKEEDEYEDEEEDNKRNYINIKDLQKQPVKKNKEETKEGDDDDSEDDNEQDIDITKVQLNPAVKIKKFNKHGLPADDGYDYDQHFYDEKKLEGELVAKLEVPTATNFKAGYDVDYEVTEMTKEQKEVFESLQQEDLYEDLDDDFIAMAQDGEDIIIKAEEQKKIAKKAAPKKKPVVNQELLNKIKEQPIQEGEDLLEDEEFDEEEFKQAMEQYEECEDEKQEQNQKKLTKNEFDGILDEHINEIQERDVSKQDQKQNKELMSKILEEQRLARQVKLQAEQDLGKVEQKQLSHLEQLQQVVKLKKRQEEIDLQRRIDAGEDVNEEEMDGLEKLRQFYPKNYSFKRILKEERELMVDDREKQRREWVAKYGDEVLGKTHYEPINVHEDQALLTYISKPEEQEEKEHNEFFDWLHQKIQPRVLDDTIVTKTFAESRVKENLNVVKEQLTAKQIARGEQKDKERQLAREKLLRKEQGIESSSEDEDEINNTNNQSKLNAQNEKNRDVSAIFAQRDKDETPEERKLRKQLVKEFNKQRKENKRAFKQGFETLSNVQKTKLNKQNQNTQNMRGVKVSKVL